LKTLVIDIGGTSVKFWGDGAARLGKLDTGQEFTPMQLVEAARPHIESESCDVVSIGYPGKVVDGHPFREPWNLGDGWVEFDFKEAFGKPVRMMNDAAMQALGGYRGGCMLFVGLGTSVGGALVIDGVVAPLELGNVPYSRRESLEDMLCKRNLRRIGRAQWSRAARAVLPQLQNAFGADYVVLGGGNAKLLTGSIPASVRLRGNHDAYLGGVRLWNCRSLGTAHWFHEGESDAPAVAQADAAAKQAEDDDKRSSKRRNSTDAK
jgi:polyphosphate glucokinase